ncbi:hypothetical protein [Providencia phage PSTCR5]|uniref:Uncharacterized protein n=1 Tax=Providencia phage PSTCR5 TaxID=2783547 RepID=A0A873WS70_9CAUD|nr:hypothetical protein KNV68_gp080 [Providencia phage PSTCR5]QPB12178.1 hypothetical protein [Providencia phage PSTCR5]
MQDKETVFVVSVVNIGLNDPRNGFLPQDVMACKTATTWAGAEEAALAISPVAVAELQGADAVIKGGRLLQFRITECETSEDVYLEMRAADEQRRDLVNDYFQEILEQE